MRYMVPMQVQDGTVHSAQCHHLVHFPFGRWHASSATVGSMPAFACHILQDSYLHLQQLSTSTTLSQTRKTGMEHARALLCHAHPSPTKREAKLVIV